MEVLDALLNFLAKDGVWHTINEISAQPRLKELTMTQIEFALRLLSEYDFIDVNERLNYNLEAIVFEAKIDSRLQEFWTKIKEVEKTERT